MIQDPLELPFDQYQRYRLVTDLLAGLRAQAEPLAILDVGGRTANLRAFLPADRVHLVDVEASAEPGLVLGDGARLPFQDRAVDVVAAFDTLEHVPPPARPAFLAECARVARRWVVVAGPYRAPAVDESERLLQRFLRDKLGLEHRYLEEHRHHGLPDLPESRAALEAAGLRTAAIGHGSLERWLPLMCLSLYLDHEPELRSLARSVFRFYNRELYASDSTPPVYRHALVAARAGAPLPATPVALAPQAAPAGLLARFDEVLGELVAFDRARGAWTTERERLWETVRTLTADLAGHRDALAAERELRAEAVQVARALEAESVEQRAELARRESAAQDQRLAVERMRAELERDLALLRAALGAAERDGEEQRARATAAGNDAERARAAAADLRADLDGHRTALAELRALHAAQEARAAELAAHLETARGDAAHARASLERREGELAASRVAAEALAADLAGHRAALADVRSDLEGHRGALRDARGEVERLRADLERLRAGLEAALHERNVCEQRLEGAHAELARAARTLQDQDRALGVLRAELASRVRSLRRALGPRRPPPA
ncbi:MAG: methyltransferase domain-containing protein [Planctomycetes bacterium]|nr:methyltransferase domain-containing protein [Planctomycetota bacterium]